MLKDFTKITSEANGMIARSGVSYQPCILEGRITLTIFLLFYLYTDLCNLPNIQRNQYQILMLINQKKTE